MYFSCYAHLFSLLVALAIIIPCIHALNYQVINKDPSTPAGKFFNQQIGQNFAKAKMKEAVKFVRKTLKQDSVYEMKIVNTIYLIIDTEGSSSPSHSNQEIHVSAKFIEEYLMGGENIQKVKNIFSVVLYQLVTRVLQWDTQGVPPGLREGIAQYVLSKTGFFRSTKLKLNRGARWDQGGEVTVQFLVYCDSLKEGFVADLNDMMKSVYQETYFNKLLGENVGDVWTQFKARLVFQF